MKVTFATFTLFFTLALCQKSTFLCNDVGGKLIQDASICSGAGGKPLGRGICCIAKSDAKARASFDIACDDKLGTTQDTGEACEA